MAAKRCRAGLEVLACFGTMQFFNQMGVPSLLAFLVIAAEFFGSLALVGFLGRVAALGIIVHMFVAVA